MFNSPAIRSPDYRRLWGGAACNQLGMIGEQVIVGLVVYRMTDSTAWVGVSLALFFLPLFIFGAFSGAIADRFDRRMLLRRIEAAIVANLALIALLVHLGAGNLTVVLCFTFAAGSLRALHQPVRLSYAYDIVGGGRVVGSIGLLNLGARTGQLVGAVLAGTVMERIGPAGAFLALALMHCISLALFCTLRSAGTVDRSGHVSTARNIGEFFREIQVNRILLMLVLVTAAVEVFGFSFTTALPELATERFDVGADGLGLMQAMRAVGGMGASIVLSSIPELRHRGIAYLVIIPTFGFGLMWLATADAFAVSLAALLLVAAMAAASDILTQSMMQLSVSDGLRGRAMGAWVVAIGFAPIGHLEMGALAASVGVGNALLFNGAALIVVGLVAALAVPQLRRL